MGIQDSAEIIKISKGAVTFYVCQSHKIENTAASEEKTKKP